MKILVGLVEDHKDYRESLSYLLSSSGEFEVRWSFESAESAMEYSTQVDVILLDINLPEMSGIEAIIHLREKYPEVRIIMLTILEDDFNVIRSIQNGADGYVLKKTNPLKIMEAIRQVIEGGSPLTPSVAKQVLNLFKSSAPLPSSDYHLTLREKEVLDMIISGQSTDEVAKALFISPDTVRNHCRHIYGKLHVHTKSQAVAKAIQERIK